LNSGQVRIPRKEGKANKQSDIVDSDNVGWKKYLNEEEPGATK
jgi:hypothetical protein